MISDFFINIAFGIAMGIGAMSGAGAVPEWMLIDTLIVSRVFNYMGSMAVWFPVPIVLVVIGAVVVSWFAGFGIKFFRAVLAHIPFIGGNG